MTIPSFAIRINVLIAALILFTIIFLVFIILPILRAIQASFDRLLWVFEEERAIEDQIAAIKEYRGIAKEVQETTMVLEGMLVDIQFPVDFVEFLETQAAQNNLSIEVSSPASSQEEGNVLFQLVLGGELADLVRFLARLETGPYLLSINKMDVERLERGRVSANISLTALASSTK